MVDPLYTALCVKSDSSVCKDQRRIACTHTSRLCLEIQESERSERRQSRPRAPVLQHKMAKSYQPYLDSIRGALQKALCLQNFPCQLVKAMLFNPENRPERHHVQQILHGGYLHCCRLNGTTSQRWNLAPARSCC